MEREDCGRERGGTHDRVQHVMPNSEPSSGESSGETHDEVEPIQGQAKLKHPGHVPAEGTRASPRAHERSAQLAPWPDPTAPQPRILRTWDRLDG